MKATKLIAIFVLLLGVVIGAFYLFSGGDGGFGKRDKTSYTEISNDLKQAWERCKGERGDSIKALFEHQYLLIDEYRKDNQIDEEQFATLVSSNSRLAIEKVNDNIFEEWEKDDCKKSDIDSYQSAIRTIQSKDNMAGNNDKLKKINQVYDTYKKAYTLAHLNTDNLGNNRDAYKKEIQSIKNNHQYKEYLSHIDDLNDGLKRTESKLSSHKSHKKRRSHRRRSSSRNFSWNYENDDYYSD